MAEKKSLIEVGKDLLEDIKKGDKDIEFIESGNIGFDLALTNGRGIPVGASVLLWADPGCGKSTILADVSKRLLARSKRRGIPFQVLYIDTEGSRSLFYDMGLRPYIQSGDFIIADKPMCWRSVETIYDAILAKTPGFENVKMIIIDSVNNIQSDANTQKSVADGDFGSKAKERTAFYTKYFGLCKERGISTMLISQVRQNLEAGPMAFDKRKAAVSWADRHNVDIILKCSKSSIGTEDKSENVKVASAFGDETDSSTYIFKMTSKGTDCKNRYFVGRMAAVLVKQGRGIDNSYALTKLLKFNDLLKVGGGWYSFDSDICGPLGLPDKKLRKNEAMDVVRKNLGPLVSLLKEMGKYNLVQPEENLEEDVKIDVDIEEAEPNGSDGDNTNEK